MTSLNLGNTVWTSVAKCSARDVWNCFSGGTHEKKSKSGNKQTKKINHKKYYYQGNIDEQVKCTLCVNYTVFVVISALTIKLLSSIPYYLQEVSLHSAVLKATLLHDSGTEESWSLGIQRYVGSRRL